MRTNHFARTLAGVILGLTTLGSAFLYMADVILQPAVINGTIQIGSEVITYVSVSASATGQSSSTGFYPPPGSTSPSYSLTVGVPSGGTAIYNVSGTIYMEGFRDSLQFPFGFQQVTASQAAPVTADFKVLNPGFIEGTITVNGGTLSSASVQTNQPTPQPRSFTNTTADGGYRFPVVPGASVSVSGTAFLSSGVSVALQPTTVSVAGGETVTLNFQVSPPPTATLTGNIQFPGTSTVNYYYVSACNSGCQSKLLNPPFGMGNSAAYSMNLLPGNNNLSVDAYLNNSDDYFRFPRSSFAPSASPLQASAGVSYTVNTSANQAYVNGTVTLTGASSVSDLASGSIGMQGVFNTNAYGGFSTDRLNPATGAYDLVVSDGAWQSSSINFQWLKLNPADYLNEYLTFNEASPQSNPIAVGAGATAQRDYSFAMGSSTVTISVAGGGTLSNPQLSGSCTKRNASNVLIYSYGFSSSASNQTNVPQGTVKFVGMEGTCNLTAFAQVGGSTVNFGQLTVNVVPGVDQQIDIGGPSVTVEFPEPDYIIDNNSITFNGKVTDDVAVSSVTVNSVQATLTSTNNPADPREKAFSATVALPQQGPNQVETIATDSSGKTGKDTRTVYRDSGPPELDFVPVDGLTTNATSIAITGTATDDSGIKALSVNGVNIPVSQGPLQVPFNTSASLTVGDNFIQVVATDISNRVTSETHKVARIVNQAPVLAAIGNKTADEGTALTFTASASDADVPANVLTYSLDAGAPVGASVNPSTGAFSWTPSESEGGTTVSVTIRVTDNDSPSLNDFETFSITVNEVNQAPVLPPIGNKSVNEGSLLTFTASATDSDVPANTLTFSLGPGAAVGAAINPGTGVFTWTPTASSSYSATIIVTDNGSPVQSDSETITITVNNVTPVISSLNVNTASINENGTVTLAGAFTDPGLVDGHVVTIDWGDGSPATTVNLGAGVLAFTDLTHQYKDDSPTVTPSDNYSIGVTITDTDGAATSGSFSPVTVANVAPAITTPNGPVTPLALGTAANVTASYSDIGSLDSHTCTFGWDDGQNSNVTGSSGSCSASRTYTAAGVYRVKVTVTDDDTGFSESYFEYVVVYDPNAGFVTGGGWIDSTAGAYVADPLLVGKANFGFVSKYKKGQSLPTGETEFQFHMANLRFNSTAYEWLVVSGPLAQYKGSGTVNGAGDYGFLLTATDGQVNGGGGVDKFRIKIWDKATSAVVYDNVVDPTATDSISGAKPQAIGGGSIVIHAAK